jgi:hypothetical protein
VRRRAILMMPEGESPHPRRSYGRSVRLEDAADNGTVGERLGRAGHRQDSLLFGVTRTLDGYPAFPGLFDNAVRLKSEKSKSVYHVIFLI